LIVLHETTVSRYEVKIPLPPAVLPALRMDLRLHPAHWRRAYPPRQVNNVYFDTPDYRNLSANVAGHTERAKLRLRWYGPNPHRIAAANLELKRKAGRVGWKEICAADVRFNLERGSWPELYRALRAGVAPGGQVWLDRLEIPALINHYRRSYFVTPDGAVRLTLDTDLRAYAQLRAFTPNLTSPSPIAETVVLELKAPVAEAARISQILGSFSARVDRFSKYVQGMLAAEGPF
jgi:hypothetical protein